jgi:hypothetical protein
VPVVAILALEEEGRRIPLARTYQRDALRALARVVMDDVESARHTAADGVIAALLEQEAIRLHRALVTVGIDIHAPEDVAPWPEGARVASGLRKCTVSPAGRNLADEWERGRGAALRPIGEVDDAAGD